MKNTFSTELFSHHNHSRADAVESIFIFVFPQACEYRFRRVHLFDAVFLHAVHITESSIIAFNLQTSMEFPLRILYVPLYIGVDYLDHCFAFGDEHKVSHWIFGFFQLHNKDINKDICNTTLTPKSTELDELYSQPLFGCNI